MGSETEKIRARVIKYCEGQGVDLGCGNAIIAPWAIGVDQRTNKDRPWIKVVADVSKILPFKTEEFDFVFSSHCLEDLEDTEITLAEWTRILKPNGYVILYLPHKDLYKGVNPAHKQEFVNADIENYLKGLNISIVESFTHQYSFLVVGKKQ